MSAPCVWAPGHPGTYPTSTPVSGSRSTTNLKVLIVRSSCRLAPSNTSLSRVPLHHLHEPPEQIPRIVRPRRRLGVVLHREGRPAAHDEPLAGPVVEVDVRDLRLPPQRLHVHRKPVVLRRDLHLPRREVLHRLIPAVVAELELERLPPEREAHDLVPQTDTEDGHVAEELRHALGGTRDRVGVAGAV